VLDQVVRDAAGADASEPARSLAARRLATI